jgi:hypothetical protein
MAQTYEMPLAKPNLITVGDQAPDLNPFSPFLVADGNLKTATDVKNNCHRLLVFCNLRQEEFAFDYPEFTKLVRQWVPPGVPLCVIVSIDREAFAALAQKRVPLQRETYGDLLPGALMIADGGWFRAVTGISASKPFPGMELLEWAEEGVEAPTLALLVGQNGLVEWAGDLTWADRPVRRLIDGTWDRSITEMACKWSQTVFFQMRFSPYPELEAQSDTAEDTLVTAAWGLQGMFVSKIGQLNTAKPLAKCIKAESQGRHKRALELLAESVLSVDSRVLSRDQYWQFRTVGSFHQSLLDTIALNKKLAQRVDDDTLQSQLESQQRSLGRLIAIIKAARDGDFHQVDALIEKLPAEERANNDFGLLRCRVDALLSSEGPEAAEKLLQLLASVEPLDFGLLSNLCLNQQWNDVANCSPVAIERYVVSAVLRQVLAGKPVAEELRTFVQNQPSSLQQVLQRGDLDLVTGTTKPPANPK